MQKKTNLLWLPKDYMIIEVALPLGVANVFSRIQSYLTKKL